MLLRASSLGVSGSPLCCFGLLEAGPMVHGGGRGGLNTYGMLLCNHRL